MEEQRYLMALSRLRGLTRAEAFALLRRYGTATEVFAARRDCGSGAAANAGAWDEALRRADEELRHCEEKGIRVLAFTASDYPDRLREINDPPFTLFYKGTAPLDAQRVISVVGTRKISEYGKRVCQNLCTEIGTLLPDTLIISGLAYGVDIHAHRACVKNSVPTVAVLAHGLDRIYPSLHRDTAREMISHGGLLTEYYTGTNPDKGNFVRRNRIVAGLADATVVVESADRGGALITAQLARDEGRAVFAFPGRADDEFSEGCNALIRDGKALLVTSAADIAKAMHWNTGSKAKTPVQGELFPTLSPEEEAVCRALKGGDGKGVDRLLLDTGLSLSDLTLTLTELEMQGIVHRMAGNAYTL